MSVAQEKLELADLIEKSQGLICMARNGRIGAGRTNLVVTTLRSSALSLNEVGGERWVCPICTASCTFEAMTWCAKAHGESDDCGYETEQPIALGGAFEFVHRKSDDGQQDLVSPNQ